MSKNDFEIINEDKLNGGKFHKKRVLIQSIPIVPFKTKMENTHIILWDFDGVLFRNPEHDYSDDFLKAENIISLDELHEAGIDFSRDKINILFTGRGYFQKEKIRYLLEKKGFYFRGFIFWMEDKFKYPIYNPEIEVKEYYKKYYVWKEKIIKFFIKIFETGVIVVDDDKEVMFIAEKLGAKGLYFKIE